MTRLVLLLLATAVLAGCGAGRSEGTASVWVTRDRGAKVLVVRKVPAGLSAMQALRRVARVETRYGGRFVQAINGIEGSLGGRRDWFYFVNGFEADRGAAEYRLRAGDVEWWDFRSWKGNAKRVPVVVGSFPEPFLHGYDGHRRSVAVIADDPAAGKAVGRLLHADSVLPYGKVAPAGSSFILIQTDSTTSFRGDLLAGHSKAGGPVGFLFRGDWHELLRNPDKFRFRYELAP